MSFSTQREKIKVQANVVDQLVAGAQSDIRQVLNMLSTWKLSNDSMSFDEGKSLYVPDLFVISISIHRWDFGVECSAKMNEKYAMMSPFDITNKMLGPYLFSATSRESLGDKMELYFHDHSFMPLFIQASLWLCVSFM
jgi:replication factor C subunit 1